MLQGVTFGVVVPALVRDAEDADNLDRCLTALRACTPAPATILVVDDGSPTPIPGALRQENQGPAAARNAGEKALPGTIDVVVFVDSDVVVPPDTFARFRARLEAEPDTAAIWATVTPTSPHAGFVARYKNLTHRHFTEQQPERTRHLTSMLVAIRRPVFVAAGGFDARWRKVSVEDVELGRTLYEGGHGVVLDRALAVEHRHRFTLGTAVRNDYRKAHDMARATLDRRAAGGASVAVEDSGERRQLHYLLGVPLGAGAAVALLLGRWRVAAGLTAALAVWERDLLATIAREEGPTFAVAALPLLVLERTTVATAVAHASAGWALGRVRRRLGQHKVAALLR